jgi:hypothetical protein
VKLYCPVLAPTSASPTETTVPEGLTIFRATPVDGPGVGDTLPVILIVCPSVYDDAFVETFNV